MLLMLHLPVNVDAVWLDFTLRPRGDICVTCHQSCLIFSDSNFTEMQKKTFSVTASKATGGKKDPKLKPSLLTRQTRLGVMAVFCTWMTGNPFKHKMTTVTRQLV